jgi:type I restriction enzyme S subunit
VKWEAKALNELGFVGRGKSKHRPRDAEHLYGGPYPFIQTGDVKHADLCVTEYSQTYSDAGLAQSKMWPAGTLCITIAANIAETAILGMDACFPDSVIGFVADESKSDARFIKYKFDTIRRQYQQVSQGVAQDNLSLEKLLSFKLTVPPPQTQRRIGAILSAYDDLIENNRRRMRLLEDAARLLYQEWFVRLRFPGHERVRIKDGVPEGWERRTLADSCASLEDGDCVESKDQGGEDYRLLQISNIGVGEFVETGNFRYVTEETFKRLNCRQVLPRHILISRMPKPIGRAWLVTEMPWRMVTAVDVAILVSDDVMVDGYFLAYHLNSPASISFCERRASGATRPRIARRDLAELPVPVPPVSLQREFREVVEPTVTLRAKLYGFNDKLRAARDLLLPRLMNGEVEVQEARGGLKATATRTG